MQKKLNSFLKKEIEKFKDIKYIEGVTFEQIKNMLGKNNSVRNEMECGVNSATMSYFFRHPENPTTLDYASLRPESARPTGSGRIFMISAEKEDYYIN